VGHLAIWRLLLLARNLLEQALVHACFLGVHHAAKLVLAINLGVLPQWHRFRHLTPEHFSMLQSISLQFFNPDLLGFLCAHVLLFQLLDVFFLGLEIGHFFVFLLWDLPFQECTHFDVFLPFLNLGLEVLLAGLLIPLQTLVDVVALSLADKLLIAVATLDNVAHFVHDALDLFIALFNNVFALQLLEFLGAHFLFY
jgi:hypothetical protein